MSKKSSDMRVEYDFSKGVRGKHAGRLKKEGHKRIVVDPSGGRSVYEVRPVFLDQDVQAVFKDSKTVNKTLRALIELVPR